MTLPAAWANRHDGECEGNKWAIDHHPEYVSPCRCYVRWLEGRLGETTARLREASNMYQNGAFYGDNVDRWFNTIELFTLRSLLPPKGAGDDK
jgi:hypothetical protein